MTVATPLTDLFGDDLTASDLKFLADRWITPELAQAAHIRRVDHATGKQMIGQRQSGEYAGLLIPYIWPGENRDREYRLRRDRWEVELRAGKARAKRKYIAPPGRGNMLYVPPGATAEMISNPDLPVVVTEGEFKTLALWRLSNHGVDSPRFLPVGLSGVWNWRGTTGKRGGPNGERLDEKGPIADLSRIAWSGRFVTIAFDADIDSNASVRAARDLLAKELRSRGALSGCLEWLLDWGKGIDDALANKGPEAILSLIESVSHRDSKGWREKLVLNDSGKIKAILINAVTALQECPEWNGVLQFDEFTQQTSAIKPTPWGFTGEWTDAQDIKLACWLQQNGIEVKSGIAREAAIVVADENKIDPLKNYVNSLTWDGTPRIDRWLIDYCGVAFSEYAVTVGWKWLVSAIARALDPGCKVDCVLILEGKQGAGKSRALRALANGWFTDQIPDLHNKDSQATLLGKWIIELSELDSLSRSEVSAHKKYFGIQQDRFRPVHGRRVKEFPRRCVFAGSTNSDEWHRDETGGRRFWPVRVTSVNVDRLAADRDQLWAEALERYRDGAQWWLEGLVADQAAEEITDRLQADPWHTPIARFLENRSDVSVSELLFDCIKKDRGNWNQVDQNRVARILKSMSWEKYNKREGSTVVKRYRSVEVDSVGGW